MKQTNCFLTITLDSLKVVLTVKLLLDIDINFVNTQPMESVDQTIN